MTGNNRVATYERYSLVQLKIAWNKATSEQRKVLKTACDLDQRLIVAKWARTNNVLMVTSYKSAAGISLIEVMDWIKSA